MNQHPMRALLAAAWIAACAAPASAGQILFGASPLTVAQNFIVIGTRNLTLGQFWVSQWEQNPQTASGNDIPVTQPLSRYTGYAPPPPLNLVQTGVANTPGATGVQIAGTTIGISMNSDDFAVSGQTAPMVGIFPGFTYPTGTVVLPFSRAGTTLMLTMQAQVPTAAIIPPASNPAYNGNAHIGMDIALQDTTHPSTPRIAVAATAFSYAAGIPTGESVSGSVSSGAILVLTPLEAGMKFNTLPATSQRFQGQTWLGFRTFQFGFSATNLSNVIAAIRGSTALLQSLGLTAADFSTRPADYALTAFHINPEIDYAGTPNGVYQGGSTRMGLALRNIQLSLQDANDCKAPHNGVDGTLGLENGDQRFLCSKAKWYDCTTTRSWATTAMTGQTVGGFQCTATGWVPAP